ncbi:Protein kinase-like domain [Pseudocohnilembus persalinus]|uniref:Protein kinase-like domain n=1 Tax=Pseudocohnilembus persalinus TaxID=266149 RepID=A0A0V0QUL8_PSEPJ|nr:Protein kinase-like domain [Pseudocohnilembus persalinus]|eukprot:KRX05999.1 Protein kinase-like domain [Pseudocohnilembus persalinus]
MENPQKGQGLEKIIDQYAFNLKDILGKGAFGSVYKGYHIKSKQKVAIKMMPRKSSNTSLDLIEKEVEAMQKLKSEYIVQILKFLQTTNNLYIVVELCENGDLQHYLQKQPKHCLSENEACNIMRQIIKGFKVMIDKGYVHRDIKPANILIHNGIYKIADLGLSKFTGQNALMHSVCGTPLYMAPQILFNEPYTNKADIWSLGLMFYEMLFNKYPWTIRDMHAMKKAIRTEPLRFPIDKPVSLETSNFIRQCLQVEEKDRISWQEIFQSKFFLQENQIYEDNSAYQQFQVDKQIKKVLQILQYEVHKKVDQRRYIETLFNQYDVNKKQELNDVQFFQFLTSIDNNIDQTAANKIFNLIDKNHDGSISLQEFEFMFNGFDFNDLEDKSADIIRDLRNIVAARGYNLKDFYEQYDINNDGQLEKVEFEALIQAVAQGLKHHEISNLFNKFDHDGDGAVSLDEFVNTLQYNRDEKTPKGNPNKDMPRIFQEQTPQKIKRYNTQDNNKIKGIEVNQQEDVSVIKEQLNTYKKKYEDESVRSSSINILI